MELCECHGHLMMDGADFTAARRRHAGGVDLAALRENLRALQAAGVTYFRDGGDALGVSAAARALAPGYGISYATPIFAIHRTGCYGAIVGRGFSDLEEYRALVAQAAEAGCDFIKLMFSGIITFGAYGALSCPGLDPAEIHDLVAIAHAAGFPVMAHVNGADTVRAAIGAGTDSIEHGYFMDRDCLERLADSDCVWVPTVAATEAFDGRPGFDPDAAARTWREQLEAVRRAAALGARIACGSDAGAVGVPHGAGAVRELSLLRAAGLTEEQIAAGNAALRKKFSPRGGDR